MVIKEEGVHPRMVNSSVMSESLLKVGLEPKGSIPVKIRRLTYWMREAICGSPDKDKFEAWVSKNPIHPNVAVCEPGCGGISLIDKFDVCPFCGDREMNTESAEEKKTSMSLPEVQSVELLDTSVQRINDLKGEMATNYHTLGTLLREVEEQCLWALRRKKDGQGKYKDFAAWARSEVKLGRTQAMKCIAVAENFTEDDVRKIGHTKLAIALQVPAAERPKLIEAAENGASKRDLEAAVSEIKGKPSSDKVTITVAPGSVTMPMFYVDDLGAKAQMVGSGITCSETLDNGVVQRYTVEPDIEGNLVLTVTRERMQ